MGSWRSVAEASATAGALTRANMAAAARAQASTVSVRRRRIRNFMDKSAPFSKQAVAFIYMMGRGAAYPDGPARGRPAGWAGPPPGDRRMGENRSVQNKDLMV